MKYLPLSFKEVSLFAKLALIIVFLIPAKLLSDLTNAPIDNYLYVLASLILFALIFKRKIQTGLIFVFTLCVIFFAAINLQITPLHLLSLVVVFIICGNIDIYHDSLTNTKFYIKIGCLGLLVYSILYWGLDNRYTHLGIQEVNISGLGVFLLATIVYHEKKWLGKLIFFIGFFTFSRNYALAVVCFFFLKWLMPRLSSHNCRRVIKLFSFTNIAIISSIILIFLSILYQRLYDNGLILEYSSDGTNRFLTLFEISNYHRFTVNTNVIEIYKYYPQLLFRGIPIDDFSTYNLEICRLVGNDYSNDRPHNFFFSYFQIYGLNMLLIIMLMSRIFKCIVNRNNFCVFIPVMIYAVFLGMGISGYWLMTSIIALAYYYNGEIIVKKRVAVLV